MVGLTLAPKLALPVTCHLACFKVLFYALICNVANAAPLVDRGWERFRKPLFYPLNYGDIAFIWHGLGMNC